MNSPTRRTAVQLLSAVAAPMLLTAKKSGANSQMMGEGKHTYEVHHDYLKLPDGRQWGYTHSVAITKDGRTIVHSQCQDAVAIFDPKGKFIKSWNGGFDKGAHGMTLGRDGNREYLVFCDVDRLKVYKTTLDGEVMWERGLPEESGVYKPGMVYKPTNAAIAPNGDIYVADGYGSSFIHQYASDGKWIRTWGGKGKEPGQMNSPHGIWLDDRDKANPTLVVADRSNNRLQYFSLDGKHLSFVTEELRRPCHFAIHKKELIIPDLQARVTIFDENNRLIAHLGDQPDVWKEKGWPNLGRDRYPAGKFNSPHGIEVDKKGNIIVVEWIKDGRVTMLRRV